MRVRFWGTRGSIAAPGPKTIRFGGNTSCVSMTPADGSCLVLDCGTGARALGDELVASGRKPLDVTLLLSHTHWDHIQGFPFFAPLFVPESRITVCGPGQSDRALREVLAGQMEFTYFPVDLDQLLARVTFRSLEEGTYELGGATVSTHYLNHPAMTLGYRVQADGATVAYLCDHEPFSDSLWTEGAVEGRLDSMVHEGDRRHGQFMAGADLVIHDAQYTPEEAPAKKNWGHSTFAYVVEMAAAAGVRQVFLTHHDPARDDGLVAELEERARRYALQRGYGVEVRCAQEGLEFEVDPRAVSQELAVPPAMHSRQDTSLIRRILVVDDDPEILALASVALNQNGDVIVTACGGAEALAAIEASIPDLVVLDLLMPQPDGMAVIRKLRSRTATAALPVLVLTSMDDEVSTRAGFNVGADDYLTKPFTIPQLRARVNACLARAEAAL